MRSKRASGSSHLSAVSTASAWLSTPQHLGRGECDMRERQRMTGRNGTQLTAVSKAAGHPRPPSSGPGAGQLPARAGWQPMSATSGRPGCPPMPRTATRISVVSAEGRRGECQFRAREKEKPAWCGHRGPAALALRWGKRPATAAGCAGPCAACSCQSGPAAPATRQRPACHTH